MTEARPDDIINFYELSEWIGTAGQPRPEQFALIKQAGYELVVNLATETSTDAVVDEAEIVHNLGMAYIHLPVVWDAPQLEDAEEFFRILRANLEKKIFVHCALNFRVSCFMYLYRTRYLGMARARAYQDVEWIWAPNETWRKFMELVQATPVT